ncbi:MAG: DUF342 domain-containing protein [Sedimentisphaerales bacterium]|nr:DUF342 domain-containing protein [Sedimentisphaerales bacterium]
MPLTANKLLKVNISSDKLTATMDLNTGISAQSLTPEQISAEISALKIVIDEQGTENIKQFSETLCGGGTPESAVIARGKSPVHDQNGRIKNLCGKNQQNPAQSEPDQDTSKQPSTGKADGSQRSSDGKKSTSDRESHYECSNIISVEKDQPLLRLIPPVSGTDGMDVYGKEIPRKPGREAQIRLGKNVHQKGDTVFADCSGKFELSGDKVTVNPKLEISGNVDFSVGNIDFPGEVVIAKNVLDLFKVKSHATISVLGIVEAAEIYADKDIYITGGVTGKDKGKISAGGDIKAKYITNAHARAKGNIEARTEIVHSDLVCDGFVVVENGPLIGGVTIARGGLKVKDLGSDADIRTIVEVGIDNSLKELVAESEPQIAKFRQKSRKIRQAIEPLLAYQKHLKAEQKAKANELLKNAYDLEKRAAKLIEKIDKLYQSMMEQTSQEIEVSDIVYGGVIIRFPRAEAMTVQSIQGPLKIRPKKVDRVLQVVAIDDKTGSVHTLPSNLKADKFWERLDKLLALSEPEEA